MKKYYIKGALIAKSGIHFSKGYMGLPEDLSDPELEIIEGDFIATNQNLLKPWAEYYMSGDLVIAGSADFRCLLPPQEILSMAMADLNDIILLLEKQSSDTPEAQTLFRQSIANSIGVLEFFLSNTLSSLVLGKEQRFKRYIEVKKPSYKFRPEDIVTPFCNFYLVVVDSIEHQNYHELEEIRSLYKKVLDSSFPGNDEIDFIQRIIEERHNYVHRNGHNSYFEFGQQPKLEEGKARNSIQAIRRFIEETYNRLTINILESFPTTQPLPQTLHVGQGK